MAGIGDLVNLNGLSADSVANRILDFVYGKNCILLRDVGLIFGVGTGIPMPLIGFEYEMPERVHLLSFSYSEYPYLNRTALINAYFRNNTRFSIKASRPITRANTFPVNYGINEALYTVLEKYTQNQGFFTILTPWGALANCLLKDFYGVKNGEREIGGQGFLFEFEKVNIPSEAIQKKQNSYLSAITAGSAV